MSEIRANTIADAAGTGPADLTGQWATRAHYHFDGTGTVSLDGSGNISSVTDNGTGDYTIAFTNNFVNDDYSGAVANNVGSSSPKVRLRSYTTANINRLSTGSGSSTPADDQDAVGMFIGDLA